MDAQKLERDFAELWDDVPKGEIRMVQCGRACLFMMAVEVRSLRLDVRLIIEEGALREEFVVARPDESRGGAALVAWGVECAGPACRGGRFVSFPALEAMARCDRSLEVACRQALDHLRDQIAGNPRDWEAHLTLLQSDGGLISNIHGLRP